MKRQIGFASFAVLACLFQASAQPAGSDAAAPKEPSSEQAQVPPKNQRVVAVILPGGVGTFAVATHREKAVAKTKSITDAAAALSGRPAATTPPPLVVFKSAEDLYESLGLDESGAEGLLKLSLYETCGQFIPGTDSGCYGSEYGGFRRITFDRAVCTLTTQPDECWSSNNVTIGAYLTFSSLAACQSGSAPTAVTLRNGDRCD